MKIAVAGMGAALLANSLSLDAEAEVVQAGVLDPSHKVPVDKELSKEWLSRLFEKGWPEVHRGESLKTIGMPVGGIAAGQLYLLGDGNLGCWEIFNRFGNTGFGNWNYQYRVPAQPVEQGFAILLQTDGKVEAKRLKEGCFKDIGFRGEYPIGAVEYTEDGFPLNVVMEAFSPFIPLNAKDSGLPATIFQITAHNTSEKTEKIAILGWLENASGREWLEGLKRTAFAVEHGRTTLLHTLEEDSTKQDDPRPPKNFADFEGETYGDWIAEGTAFGTGPAKGTLPNQQPVTGFTGLGLVNSFSDGDAPKATLTSPLFTIDRFFLNFLIAGGAYQDTTCMQLLIGDKVVRSASGDSTENLKAKTWNLRDLQGKEARIRIVDAASEGWGHICVDDIALADEASQRPAGPLTSLKDYGSMALSYGGRGAVPSEDEVFEGLSAETKKTYPAWERYSGAMRSSWAKLKPGSSKTFTFVIAWHFPNAPQGQRYANDFGNAKDVAEYVLRDLKRLAGDTRKWRDTYYDSTLPWWLLDRIMFPTSNLATETCQWWKDGRFWAYEGVGCCHGTCTHVWNYAHTVARLFPELERTTREMQDLSIALQDDGMVGHRGLCADGLAADGQMGTILKSYREHLMSPDSEFLKRNWSKIKKVMEFAIGRDENEDGVIENTQFNTYDIAFEGFNTFTGSLYLAALRACEEMAREMGETEFADRLRRIFESGSRLTVERLWNGEYFIQDVDVQKFKYQYGKGCLSDQMFGQGWAHQLGLGYLYPEKYVRAALASVWKYNWTPDVGPQNAIHAPGRIFASPGEAGLLTCTWPKSPHLGQDSVMYRDEVWTGIEYQVAGHAVWEGMLDESLAIIKGVHERYDPIKHNPYNEVECGDHYARAFASWGVLIALSGFRYHGPNSFLGFNPKITPDDFRCVFTAAEGWGTLLQKREASTQTNEIHVRWGLFGLESLALSVPEGFSVSNVTVHAGHFRVKATWNVENEEVKIALGKKISLRKGQSLKVEIS